MSDPSADARIAWRDVFGNAHPVEFEIGPGSGDVLLGYASSRPSTNFFGIERRPGAAERIMQRAARLGLGNVRVISGDARWVVMRILPDASVSAYHVYFPDPWPKTRHAGRRLTGNDFAAAVRRTLVVDGAVHVASDLHPLVEGICGALTRAGLVRVPSPAPPADRVISVYERRYASGGTHYARLLRPA